MSNSVNFRNEFLDIFGVEMMKERNEIDKILLDNPILKNAEIIRGKVIDFLKNG